MLQIVHDEICRASGILALLHLDRFTAGIGAAARRSLDRRPDARVRTGLHSRSSPRTSRTMGPTSPMIGVHAKKWGLRRTALWLVAVVCAWLLCSASARAQEDVPSDGPGAPPGKQTPGHERPP